MNRVLKTPIVWLGPNAFQVEYFYPRQSILLVKPFGPLTGAEATPPRRFTPQVLDQEGSSSGDQDGKLYTKVGELT